MDIYSQIEQKSLPHIDAYRNDLLVHDKLWIQSNPGKSFLHMTHATGTTLIDLPDADLYPGPGHNIPHLFANAERDMLLAGKKETFVCAGRTFELRLVLHCDGQNVRELSREQAESLLDDYVDSVKRRWHSAAATALQNCA